MRRNWHMAMQHIKENLGSVCIMMLELVVVMVLSAYFFSQVIQFIREEQAFSELSLSQVARVREENLSSLPEAVKVLDYNQTVASQGNYQGNKLFLNVASSQYFSYFSYPLRKGTLPDPDNTTVIQGVFPDALKHLFKVGEIYRFTMVDMEVEVLMVGQMESNYMYLHSSNEVRPERNSILIYDGTGNIPVFSAHTVTVVIEEEASLTEEQKALVAWAREHQALHTAIARRDVGIPMVMAVLLFVLSIATFAGYNVMQILQKEKIYGVYYLCGASWRDCVQIQLFIDTVTVGSPLCVVTVLLYLYGILEPNSNSEPLLSWAGFGVILGICLLTFLLTSLGGILRLQKKSPVTIIERWNQT